MITRMKTIFVYIFLSICCIPILSAQTLNEAKELYKQGQFAKALPVFAAEYQAKPADPSLNHWYGVCLFETGGDLKKAEELLLTASKKRVQDSFLYLGKLYTKEFRFTEASDAFNKYQALLKKKDEESHARLEEERKVMGRLNRMVSNTEDIQIIDSLIVDKADFLSAYKLSRSSGKLDYFKSVFSSNKPVESTVYFNEKETKIYYGQPDSSFVYALFSMEKLLEKFGDEKKLSKNNFGIAGDVNYPYVMTDGVTIYFAAKDEESIGGYDLFVSRYNMNNDTYLTPERLNMPFNSIYDDYLMVIDEEKGVGWFASDRLQIGDKVCIYTFIPNTSVKTVESDDEAYMANRARISSIKKSWIEGKDYRSLISLARKAPVEEVVINKDFEFVINDKYTYYNWSDFKSKAARDNYFKVIQLKNELKALLENLDNQRNNYISSSQEGKRRLTSIILDLEKKQEQIQNSIPALEVQARNQEIQVLK